MLKVLWALTALASYQVAAWRTWGWLVVFGGLLFTTLMLDWRQHRKDMQELEGRLRKY